MIRKLGTKKKTLTKAIKAVKLKEEISWLFNPVSRLRIGLVPGNVVMVAIDMYGKSLREWIYGVT